MISDTLLALLAGAGALAIGWVLFGRLVAPAGAQRTESVFAVIRVFVDAGLSEEGRRLADSLSAHKAPVSLCPLPMLGGWITAVSNR